MLSLLIKTLSFRKSSDTAVQFWRSFIAGGVATLLDIALLYILTDLLGVHYLLSAAAGFIAGVILLYFVNILWIFDKRKHASRQKEFLIFCLISIIGLVLNEIIIYSGVEFFGIWYVAAKIGSTLMVFVFNFYFRKKLLFS